MAEYVMPPEMEAFVEACGDVAMDNFDPAAFEADPSAAFADTMGAVMDFMGDSGMPPEMMGNFQDVAQGCFDQYMGDNPDAAPMDAFDAVGAGIDHHMADMPPDMPCADMAGEMPPPPGDFGPFMDECPPCGSFPGGESYDPGAHPHEGGMADMMGPPPGDMAGPPPGEGGPPPGDMAGDQDQWTRTRWTSSIWIWGQDQWTADQVDRVIWLVSQDQWTADQVVLIHYLDQENLHRQVDQMDHLQELTWMVMECLLLLQVIWVEMDPMGPPPDDMGQMHSHMDDAGAHHQPGPEGPEGPPPGADMDGDGMAPPPPPDDPSDDVV